MLLLVPLGSEREAQAPRLTLGLLALNVLAFALTASAIPGGSPQELERVASWALQRAAEGQPGLLARVQAADSPLAFLERDPAWREQVPPGEPRDRLEAVVEDWRALRARHPFFRHGLVSARLSAPSFLTHQFLHADLLHLGGNLLFLWVAGGLLERSLGPLAFGLSYLGAGVAAGLAHVLATPGSEEPAIGASGAISGLLGLLLVRHGSEPMRLALVALFFAAPRLYLLTWPAWVFLLLWLAEQVFYAGFGPGTLGVAFVAHLGGFGGGVLAGWLLARLCPSG